MNELESDRSNLATLTRQLAAAGGNDTALQSEIQSVRSEYQTQVRQVLDLLREAMTLAEADTSREDINSVRYLQTVAHFALEEYFESALIGEFLMDRYRNVPGTKEAAGVVVKSYLKLYQRATRRDGDSTFERKRLWDTCERVIKYWPGEAICEHPCAILTQLSLQDKKYDEAEGFLAQLPASSPARNGLEIVVGRALWNKYKIDQRNAAKQESNADQMKSTRDRAFKYLSNAVPQVSSKNISADNASAALALAQIYLEKGEVKKAVAQLEDAEIAPLDLVKQKHAAAQDPRFLRDTYKTALKAYIASMRQGEDTAKWVGKAQGIVGVLRKSLQDHDPDNANRQMVAIYYQLARELLARLEAIESVEEKREFADSLATFLKTVQVDSKDAKIQLWVGSTLCSVAESLPPASDQTKRLYRQAVEAMESAKKIGFRGDPQAAAFESDVNRRIAIANRGLGNYEKAVDFLTGLLRQRNTAVTLQMEAARTYQTWGDQKEVSSHLVSAVSGSQREAINGKRPANLIWGWKKLATATRNKEQFRDLHFEAVYNLCWCRFRYGQLEDRDDAKQVALKEIQVLKRSFPEFDKGRWQARFDALARQIQKELGQTETGIR